MGADVGGGEGVRGNSGKDPSTSILSDENGTSSSGVELVAVAAADAAVVDVTTEVEALCSCGLAVGRALVLAADAVVAGVLAVAVFGLDTEEVGVRLRFVGSLRSRVLGVTTTGGAGGRSRDRNFFGEAGAGEVRGDLVAGGSCHALSLATASATWLAGSSVTVAAVMVLGITYSYLHVIASQHTTFTYDPNAGLALRVNK